MIFETTKKDLMIRGERILEIEKRTEKKIEKTDYTKKIINYSSLYIMTLDTQRTIVYENEKERDKDYENVKLVIELSDKITQSLNSLNNVLEDEK